MVNNMLTTSTANNNDNLQSMVNTVALCNRADHYMFALWFLSFFFLFFLA